MKKSEMGKIEEYKRKIQEYEEKVREEAKLFNIRDFLRDSIMEKHVEGLGMVRFGHLSIKDYVVLSSGEYADDLERTLMIITLMLKKADKTVTLEQVKDLPAHAVVKLVAALGKEAARQANFLQELIRSVGGLGAAQSPRQSEPSATGSN